MPDPIHTGGGAIYAGPVQAGTVIGHDQILRLRRLQPGAARPGPFRAAGDARRPAGYPPGGPRAGAPDGQRTRGPPGDPFQGGCDGPLVGRCQTGERTGLPGGDAGEPRYGRWATQFVPLAGLLTTEEPAPEYTELEVLGEGPRRQVRRVRLENVAEALGRHHAVALLGEPGAGKTTTLYRLALEAARRRLEEGQGPFPVSCRSPTTAATAPPTASWRRSGSGSGPPTCRRGWTAVGSCCSATP